MHDDHLDPRDGVEPQASRPPKESPLLDQELPAVSARVSDAVHAWLDGEPVTDAALSAAPREVALWKKIEAETTMRRRMVTPAHVPAQILSKLDDTKR